MSLFDKMKNFYKEYSERIKNLLKKSNNNTKPNSNIPNFYILPIFDSYVKIPNSGNDDCLEKINVVYTGPLLIGNVHIESGLAFCTCASEIDESFKREIDFLLKELGVNPVSETPDKHYNATLSKIWEAQLSYVKDYLIKTLGRIKERETKENCLYTDGIEKGKPTYSARIVAFVGNSNLEELLKDTYNILGKIALRKGYTIFTKDFVTDTLIKSKIKGNKEGLIIAGGVANVIYEGIKHGSLEKYIDYVIWKECDDEIETNYTISGKISNRENYTINKNLIKSQIDIDPKRLEPLKNYLNSSYQNFDHLFERPF